MRAPLLYPSPPKSHIKLHHDHKLFDISGMFQHCSYVLRLPRAFLERRQSYVSQRRQKSRVYGRPIEEEPRMSRIGMLDASRRVARRSETPRRSLVVAGPLVEEVKRGGEDELGVLD